MINSLVHWLQASRSRRAEAVVIEARVDRGQGPVATVVVKRGTLKVRAGVAGGWWWQRVGGWARLGWQRQRVEGGMTLLLPAGCR